MSQLERPAPHLEGGKEPGDDWLKLAQEAYRFSTTYIDSNYRKRWEDSILAFNNSHPMDSKYNSPSFSKRSKLYRPKTRAIIRKNEAAAAAAFFSNMDVVSVQAQNQANKQQCVSADIMKELLQYRLKKSIPWFQTVLGGLQDAQKTGAVCACIDWEYEEEKTREFSNDTEDETTEGDDVDAPQAGAETAPEAARKIVTDRPTVELIPIENIRIDPAASWIDPVNTSPYIIHLMPMYVGDIKDRMMQTDPKTGRPKWKPLSDNTIRQASQSLGDSTRIVREKQREDPKQTENRPISDYEIAWVQRHIHRRGGQDWEFYTMGDIAMLSEPVPLSESILHGKRNYVIGCCILETHTSMPSSVSELSKGLQDEANEIVNQRLDNVKLVLNKRWLVNRGKNVDIPSLVRNVPGGVTMADDVKNDIQEVNWPDVTASSYQEQDRINADMDELLGNFSASSIMTNPDIANNAPARSMQMLSAPAGMLVEYLIRTYVETFIEPVLRLLVLCEQKYETDEVVMAIAVENSQMFQRYGLDRMTDELLNQELTLTVNVGMGATDPQSKLQKLVFGVQSYGNIVKMAVPGLNVDEIGKQIFGFMGYQDGKRFMTVDDPQKLQLQEQLKQAQGIIQQLQQKVQEKQTGHQVKALTSQAKNQTDLAREAMKQDGENRRTLATHIGAIHKAHLEHALAKELIPDKPAKGKDAARRQ